RAFHHLEPVSQSDDAIGRTTDPGASRVKPEDAQPLAPKRGVGRRGAPLEDTLFLPHGRAGQKPESRAAWTLPPHLQEQLPRRLRAIALLYSLVFFLSDLAPSLVTGEIRRILQAPAEWVPPVASILT